MMMTRITLVALLAAMFVTGTVGYAPDTSSKENQLMAPVSEGFVAADSEVGTIITKGERIGGHCVFDEVKFFSGILVPGQTIAAKYDYNDQCELRLSAKFSGEEAKQHLKGEGPTINGDYETTHAEGYTSYSGSQPRTWVASWIEWYYDSSRAYLMDYSGQCEALLFGHGWNTDACYQSGERDFGTNVWSIITGSFYKNSMSHEIDVWAIGYYYGTGGCTTTIEGSYEGSLWEACSW